MWIAVRGLSLVRPVDGRLVLARRRRRAVVVSILFVAVVGLGAADAMASPDRRGATYDGRGRQPHFSHDGFILRFQVARSGRRIERLYVWDLTARCRPLQYDEVMPRVGSAPIERDGTFRVRLKTSGRGRNSLTLAGRFLRHGRARGTLRYRGYGALAGCNADGVWPAHVKPPPPPVQQFVGTTDRGTRVSFQRTIEPHPHVTRFDFGSIQTSCGSVAGLLTGREITPPYDQFALPVQQDAFSGMYGSAYQIAITGRFDARDQASGTVAYVDRSGCSISNVRWTARPTATQRARGLRRRRRTSRGGWGRAARRGLVAGDVEVSPTCPRRPTTTHANSRR